MYYIDESGKLYEKVGIDFRVKKGLQTLEGLRKATQEETEEGLNPTIDLETLRAAKFAELSKAKCDSVCRGFVASIIGHDVHYRTNEHDQMRIMRGCRKNGATIWEGEAATHHTQAQCDQLQDYFDLHMEAKTTLYASLFQRAKDVTEETRAEFDNIAWGNDVLITYPE